MGLFDDLKEINDDLKEIGEIATDGFKEMVIKGNDDYKTSYEKMEEAELIVEKAKAEYKKSKAELRLKCNSVNSYITQHYYYKEKIYHDVLQKWIKIMKEKKYVKLHKENKLEFEEADIDVALNNINGFNGLSIIQGNPMQFNSFTNLSMGTILPPPIKWPSNQRKRIKKANKKLKEAKLYRKKVKNQIAKLNKQKAKLKKIKKTAKDEKRVLSKLEKRLKRLNKLIEDYNGNAIKEQADKIKISAIIADGLSDALSAKMIDTDNIGIRQEYEMVLNKLKNIESKFKNF